MTFRNPGRDAADDGAQVHAEARYPSKHIAKSRSVFNIPTIRHRLQVGLLPFHTLTTSPGTRSRQPPPPLPTLTDATSSPRIDASPAAAPGLDHSTIVPDPKQH